MYSLVKILFTFVDLRLICFKGIYILLSFLIVAGCTSHIHPQFSYTNYINNFHTHVINDSIEFYLRGPGDYYYETDMQKLSSRIKKQKGYYGALVKGLNNILIFGITENPYHEYYLAVNSVESNNSKNKILQNCSDIVVLDTLINDYYVKLVGKSSTENRHGAGELEDIISSIRIGKSYQKDIFSVLDIVDVNRFTNRFLEVYEKIKGFPTYNDKSKEWIKLQMQLTYASFFQNHPDYKALLPKFEIAPQASDSLIAIIQNNMLKDTSSYNAILKDAAITKVVMINENHFVPEHRLLTSKLLESLKDLGYSYLAFEGLDNGQDSLLNFTLSYPTLETGFYTREATFGNLIREARKLDYTLVAYETFDDSVEREEGQATTLFNKTFLKDPNAKVVVHAGISHILERPTEGNKKWMAAIFKEKYGIDPLTIDQTQLNRYRKVFDEQLILIPSKVFDDHGLNSVDYLVLNNLSLSDGDENTIPLQYKNEFEEPVQLNVFLSSELSFDTDYNHKVPISVYYLERGDDILFHLPKEEVLLVVYNKEGKVLERKNFP